MLQFLALLETGREAEMLIVTGQIIAAVAVLANAIVYGTDV
ncbi:hypothetical protein [Nocardia vinacea]|nr:hypothetical protein [Nocardia vinacea]